MTVEQLSNAVDALTERAMVHEGLLSDCLAILVAVDADSMAALRDASMRAAAKLQNVADDSEVAQWRTYWIGRAKMLESVLAQAGAPWKSAEIVDLKQAREGAGVRWGDDPNAANRRHGTYSCPHKDASAADQAAR